MSEVIYALDTFQASQEGQLTVIKNDQLLLLNDDHYYWWYVQEVNSSCMGFVPAELLEFPNERLARQNSLRNQTVEVEAEEPKQRPNRQRSVRFTPSINDVPDLSMDCSSSESDLPLVADMMVLPRGSSRQSELPPTESECCKAAKAYEAVPGMAANLDRMNELEKRLRHLIDSSV